MMNELLLNDRDGKLKASPSIFTKEDLLPKTGYDRPQTQDPELVERVKSLSERMQGIFVHNPFHKPVFETLDFLMTAGVPGVIQFATRNAAESYSGKSACGEEYIKIVERRNSHPAGSRPVIRVELDQACTGKRFWAKINSAFGDGFADTKDEVKGRASAYRYFKDFGTVLVIIDEAQHALFRSKGKSAASDYIKRFISDKVVAVALFGTGETKDLHKNSVELANRFAQCCDIQPANLTDAKQLKDFKTFFGRFDQQLLALGEFRELSRLDDRRISACLAAMCQGYIGRAAALVKLAALRACQRRADYVEVCDLSYYVDNWAIGTFVIKSNPFTLGIEP